MTNSLIEVAPGDPDALVRIRVDSVQPLEQVVNNLRKNVLGIGAKTLMVLSY